MSDPVRSSSHVRTEPWPNAHERRTLRRWKGTVVDPARMFDRLLTVIEELEGRLERAEAMVEADRTYIEARELLVARRAAGMPEREDCMRAERDARLRREAALAAYDSEVGDEDA